MTFPPSLFKTYTSGETLTASDLNSSLTDISNTNIPEDIDDYSANATEMRSTADPYPGSSESLATTIAGELERLRYVIGQITGETYWYQDPDRSLTDLTSLIGSSATQVLVPDGAVGAPSLSFANYTDKGIYSGAAGTLDFAIGGAQVASLSATDFGVKDGTVSKPGLYFLSDTDNGIYKTGSADSWVLVAGGSPILNVDSTPDFPVATLALDYDQDATTQFSIRNDNNTSSAAAKLYLYVGGTSAADPNIHFEVASGGDWTIGIDNTASDAFKISASDALGSSDVLTLSSTNATWTTSSDFQIQGTLMQLTQSADATTQLSVRNANNTSNAAARIYLFTGGTSASDPYITFQITGGANAFSMGMDNSDSDAFVLGYATTLGSNTALKIDTNGDVELGGNNDLDITTASFMRARYPLLVTPSAGTGSTIATFTSTTPYCHLGADGDTTNVSTRINGPQTTGASVGTLNNAPSVGDPTQWIQININGSNRYIPCW